jgi:hypothetical protein
MKPGKIIQQTVVDILTILILSCFIQSVVAQGNLVVNGGFDTDASGWTLTNVGFGYLPTGGNPPGCVDLDNPSSLYAPTASQEINSLTPGTFYIVSGDYQSGGKGIANNSFGVALDGVYLFEANSPPTYNWYSFSFEYMATSTSALLSISAQLNGTDYPYAIDNIAVNAVPEPNSLCLMGVGGMMSALFFRHRRKARRE